MRTVSGRKQRTIAVVSAVLFSLLAAACSSGAGVPLTTSPATSTTSTGTTGTTGSTGTTGTNGTTTTTTAGANVSSDTTWLCRPGLADDPCTSDLDSTSVSADGTKLVRDAAPASDPKFDCFYVYPTVSKQPTVNANLTVDPAEIEVAIQQASRFSQLCRVWAPMYRQVTDAGLSQITPAALRVAYSSLLSGWRDYLAHDNHGRPIIFIGHSQGAAMLIQLLKTQVDADPSLRKLLVSAILLGGNVQVPVGKTVGGTFRNIPACVSDHETGCVIAYSSFLGQPPIGSLFGRPGTGVSLLSGQTDSAGMMVMCVNPADISGASALLEPYYEVGASASITTPWVEYPHQYSAVCLTAEGATWLQVTYVSSASDPRQRLSDNLGPLWGLHDFDVNLALGNLLKDVADEEAAYR